MPKKEEIQSMRPLVELIFSLRGNLLFILTNVIKLCLFSLLISNHLQLGYFLISVGTLIIICSFSLVLTSLVSRVYLWLCSLFISLILLINIWHQRYFNFPFSLFEVLQINNLSGLGPSILAQLRWIDIFFFVDIFLYIFLSKCYYTKRSLKTFGICIFIGLCLISVKPLKVKYSLNLTPKQTFRDIYFIIDPNFSMLRWTPLWYTVADVYNFVQSNNSKIELTTSTGIHFRNFLNSRKNLYSDFEYKLHGYGRGKNLLVIQVESLETLLLNQTFNGHEITPNLNRINRSSIYFPNIIPQVRAGNSSDAEFMFNTSLLPLKNGSVFFRFPYNHYNSLASILKRRGYSTVAFHGDEASFWNRKEAYKSLEFDSYFSIENFRPDEIIGMGLSDKSFFLQSYQMLKNIKQPFYAFFITLTSHTPYDIPEDERNTNLPDVPYLQSIHYTDKTIGMFIDLLKKDGMLENSIIVFYGDHKGLNPDERKQLVKLLDVQDIVDLTDRIPFIIYHPSIKKQEHQIVGGQIDMFPTVANVMGINTIEFDGSIIGGDLFKLSTLGQASSDVNNQEALEISDLLIRSNYFERHNYLNP